MTAPDGKEFCDGNPMQQARAIAELRAGGLSVQDIADRLGTTPQVIRIRLQLLELPPDVQAEVERGEFGLVRALKLVKAKESK